MSDNQTLIHAALRARGIRPTTHRVALLGTLATAKTPKTAEELHARMGTLDLVTVYRNLESLVTAGFVTEVRFKDTSVRYELAGAAHHHHVVCTTCGVIDELPGCGVAGLEKKVLAASKRFASVEEHALEFFGTCVKCAR